MADEAVTRAYLERVTADMTAALAAINAQLTELRVARDAPNGGEERAQREAPIRVLRVERARAVVVGDSSLGEEDPVNNGRDEEEERYDSDYRMKADIPLFHGTMAVEEFLDWHIEGTATVWWDRLVVQRRRQGKAPIRTWRRMKQLMLDRFLPEDYEQILYKLYLDCVQGRRSVTEYSTEFLRLSERNELKETKNQKVARYISGLKFSIQEKMGLQTVWSVAAASTLALKAKSMERNTRGFQTFPRYPPQGTSEAVGDKEESVVVKEQHTELVVLEDLTRIMESFRDHQIPTLSGDKCYRCGGHGHRSNVCPIRRTVALLKEREAEEHDEGDEYESVEFAEEESTEAVNIVLQRVLLTTPDKGQRKNLFKSHCSILNKVCNLIVDNGSAENLISQKLVDHLKLPTESHEKPYALGWVSKGSQVRVTRTCKVPISIGKHYREEVPCDVLDMDVCHVLLGRPWQYDLDVTYRGRDNVIMFTWEKHKIALTPISSFNRQPSKQTNFLVLKVGDDVIQPRKHGPFKVDEVLYLEENSGSSSFEVEETYVGAFTAPN
ncbi:hypothetical protein QQ045_015521 [Rhodiola kirilowii]